MLGLFAALCSSSRACADTADRWRNLADQIFYPAARDLNLPNVLIPEVIAQDGQGFIWPGEETGMLRWDGYRLRSYTYDEAVPDGLQHDFIQSLHADRQVGWPPAAGCPISAPPTRCSACSAIRPHSRAASPTTWCRPCCATTGQPWRGDRAWRETLRQDYCMLRLKSPWRACAVPVDQPWWTEF